MRQNLTLHGIILPILLAAATISPGAPPTPDPTDLKAFLPTVVVDKFNPDVTDADRAAPAPTRGGRLRIGTSADVANLNSLLAMTQNDNIVINLMTDALVEREPATLEYYPEMAWRWTEADLVRRSAEETPVAGRIVETTDTGVRFVPGARRVHLALVDVASRGEGTVTLTEARGGEVLKGTITAGQWTITIDEAGDPARETVAIPLAELAEYEVAIGATRKTLPFAKPSCHWTFAMREGVTWQDGQPVTGHDVKFGFDTLNNPHVDAQRVRVSFDFIQSCTVSENGGEVTFTLSRPYFKALEFMGGIRGNRYILPRHIFQPEKFGGDDKAFGEAFNKHPFNERPVYTGPYRFKEHRRGTSITVERNTDYWKNKLPDGALPRWDPQRPYLDEIVHVVYRDAIGLVRDAVNGSLDLLEQVEPTTWNMAETKTPEFLARMVRIQELAFAYTYIGWNFDKPMFQDKRLRQALSLLVPREEIAANVHLGCAIPVSGPFFAQGPCYDKTIPPDPYDPDEARRILTRAGWLDRDKDGVLEKRINGEMVKLEFTYSIHNARDYHQKIADIIKERFEQVGARVTIEKHEWTRFSDLARQRQFDSLRFAWGTEMDPDPFAIWHSSQIEGGGDNFTAYRNPEVDSIVEAIRHTMDPATRWELGRRMHRIVHEDQAQCFMFAFLDMAFADRRLRGVRYYPSSYSFDYTEWWWGGK